MKRLYVLYDRECELCRRCRVWLDRQAAFVRLTFIPFQAAEAECRFPELRKLKPAQQLAVISDTGDVWQGGAAWVMVLWALREYREWSFRLASPALLPFARRVCELVSHHRYNLSLWLRDCRTDDDLRARLSASPTASCESVAWGSDER